MVSQRWRHCTKVTRARLQVEALEERAVPAAVVFYLDDTISYLTVAGDIAGIPAEPQGDGSTTALVTGQVMTDIDLAGGALSILRDDTSVAALDSGDWLPDRNGALNRAPSNFGIQAEIIGLRAYAAIRDAIVTSYTTSPLALTDNGDGFYSYPSRQQVAPTAGIANYNAGGIFSGTANLPRDARQNNAADSWLFSLGDGTYYMVAFVDVTVTVNINTPLGPLVANLYVTGSVEGYGYELGRAPGGDPGAGRDLAPALGYLSTLDTAATPVALADLGLPLALTPAAQPADDVLQVAAPAAPIAAEPVQAVRDAIFADLFAGAF